MAAKFSLIPAAQNDLLNIRRFSLKYWGRVQASNYLRELDEIFRSLAQAPGIGRNRKEDLSIDAMSFPHKSHMIYY
jgi:toxin ParE1/3/4